MSSELEGTTPKDARADGFKLAVCVYCGSSFGNSAKYADAARSLGELFHQLQWKLVYGGGTTGLMGTVARATMGPDCDGYVHGIIPNALVAKERDDKADHNALLHASVDNHTGVTPISEEYGATTIVPDMHTRKAMMARESDAFVALPGGYGTLEEVMECITWSQLGIHQKPIILFNIDGFYDSLLAFVDRAIADGFISRKNGDILEVATSPEEVVRKIENYHVPDGRFNLRWADM
ncbi:AEL175Cp [Eremothecium gossypii ATCC 10895]|uniref:AEL175Cp n=1 Tax=Eremothecium gossypii (strain ATCC 10895 / CBS 109.51 / FGSC 9923 / NRRL Y-1056) TaxID=284811 RepID=Q758C7_EREGS|nr:AEL175Cp [Eremothecium gossypii ATCC 10895]AAS52510.1 AEL175Cp [Eremothecium gossypii ATCC 10895]AEY96810.1 FAEL175Cp [Eremothecium gossypii FDAG1]